MKTVKIAALFLAICTQNVLASDGQTERFIQLQFAMQDHIESNLINGSVLHLDFATGTTEGLYPVDAHPMILKLKDHYVLCSELSRSDGSTIPVDFYITDTSDGFQVFKHEIANRAPLKALVEAGLAKRVR